MKTLKWLFFLILMVYLMASLVACSGPQPTQELGGPRPTQNLGGLQPAQAVLPNATAGEGQPAPTATSTPIPTPTDIPDNPSPTTLPAAQPTPTVETPAAPIVETPAAVAPATGLPTPVQPPSTSPTPAAAPTQLACTQKVAFEADVTIPDGTSLQAGQAFQKIWRVRNLGDCAWDASYSLIFAYGEQMSSPLSIPLPPTAPQQTADIAVDLVAPQRGGTSTGNWQFSDPNGQTFGVGADQGYLWAQIVVQYDQASPGGGGPGVAPTQSPADCGVQPDTSYDETVLSLINDARAQAGLGSLTMDSQLSAAALLHSTDMACQDYVGHTGSDGSTWYDRAQAEGYTNYTSARENIYVGAPEFGGDPNGAFTWWMNSQVHRDNILYETVTQVGIAYVYLPGSTYGGYYSVVFARP